jgi:hypothetical protein
MEENTITDAEFEEINDAQVNVGTPGHIDHAVEAQEEVLNDLATATAEQPDQKKMSKQEIVKALRGAVEDGALSGSRAKQIRQEMGIFQTDFTGKKISDKRRKAKRKAQKSARKKQRK